MKVTWQIDDIEPGRVIFKPDCGMSGVWIIGYRILVDETDPSRLNSYGLVSMADGMFMDVGSGSKEAVMQHLNTNSHLPIELLELMFFADMLMLLGMAITIFAAWQQPEAFNFVCVAVSVGVFVMAQLNKRRFM